MPKSIAAILSVAVLMVFLVPRVVLASESNFARQGFLEPYVLTIKGVYLKNEAGEWIKIIEPDRRVDLSQEEPAVGFFNNQGRVPAGNYRNFRIVFSDKNSAAKKISSREDLQKTMFVKNGSYIRVSFDLLLKDKIEVQKADVSVDADSRRFISDMLKIEE